jgi:hypothetical protein
VSKPQACFVSSRILLLPKPFEFLKEMLPEYYSKNILSAKPSLMTVALPEFLGAPGAFEVRKYGA